MTLFASLKIKIKIKIKKLNIINMTYLKIINGWDILR